MENLFLAFSRESPCDVIQLANPLNRCYIPAASKDPMSSYGLQDIVTILLQNIDNIMHLCRANGVCASKEILMVVYLCISVNKSADK